MVVGDEFDGGTDGVEKGRRGRWLTAEEWKRFDRGAVLVSWDLHEVLVLRRRSVNGPMELQRVRRPKSDHTRRKPTCGRSGSQA